MDSQSQQGSTSVGCSGAKSKAYSIDDIARIKSTSRNQDIWTHFDLVVMKDGVDRAHCKSCLKFYAPQANTSLRNHMAKCKGVMGQSGTQTTLGADGGVFIYDNDALREAFTKFVIQQALPFNHFDNPRLTEIIRSRLQPRYNPVSRTTLRSDALALWENAKQDIINGFANYKYAVSVTCDVWTAPHGTANGFLAVTAHWFIPESWLLMKRTIAFKCFGYPHTGCNLRTILQQTFREYKLEDKVFTISVDNASNNTAALERLSLAIKPILDGAFFHGRCVAHIINLAVQAALIMFSELRNTFRKLLNTIYTASNARQMKYRKFRKECNEVPLGPCFDNNTRWNSTCYMFENILRQKTTLNSFNEQLVSRRLSVSISNHEWDQLAKLTDFLQVFKESTTLLSGVYYPTSPLVLNQLYKMSLKLHEQRTSPDPMFKKIAKVMKKKFVKYFGRIPLAFSCAAALNPTLNVGGVKFLMREIMYNLGCEFGPLRNEPDFVENQLFIFKETFDGLFAHYVEKYGQQQNPIVDQMRAGSSSSHMGRDLDINLYNNLMQDAAKRQRSDAPSSELGLYSCTNFMSQLGVGPADFLKFDVVAFWKEREVQFPVLSIMARDLFTVQASTVASESAFSVSGRIISERRSRLTPEAVEVCVCLKDYLDGVERIQHKSSLEGPVIGGDVEETMVTEENEQGISPTTTDLDEGEFEEHERDEDEAENYASYLNELVDEDED